MPFFFFQIHTGSAENSESFVINQQNANSSVIQATDRETEKARVKLLV